MTAIRKPTSGFWIVVTLGALPVLYVLSIGPVAACLMGREEVTATFLSSYRPVIWAMRKSDAVLDVVNWYIGIWTSGGVKIT